MTRLFLLSSLILSGSGERMSGGLASAGRSAWSSSPGLVVGAHYIDIAGSGEKYLPYFPRMNRAAIRWAGVLAVLVGVAIGTYMSLLYSLWFLGFVVLGGLFALFYPVEKPKWLHSYPGFGVAWGFMPVLASYYIQGLRIDLVGLGLAVFLGITVVEMHHMAVLTNEREYGPETSGNARLLLKLHRGAAYAIGLILLLSRLTARKRPSPWMFPQGSALQ